MKWLLIRIATCQKQAQTPHLCSSKSETGVRMYLLMTFRCFRNFVYFRLRVTLTITFHHHCACRTCKYLLFIFSRHKTLGYGTISLTPKMKLLLGVLGFALGTETSLVSLVQRDLINQGSLNGLCATEPVIKGFRQDISTPLAKSEISGHGSFCLRVIKITYFLGKISSFRAKLR